MYTVSNSRGIDNLTVLIMFCLLYYAVCHTSSYFYPWGTVFIPVYKLKSYSKIIQYLEGLDINVSSFGMANKKLFTHIDRYYNTLLGDADQLAVIAYFPS